MKSGAGLVFLGVPKDIYDITAAKTWETMAFPLTEEELYKKLDLCDVCLIGPGLGRSQRAERLVYEVIRRSEVPLIIDADGINAVGRNIDVLDDAECPLILTPHEGEFARLGGVITGGDRINAARDFAAKHGCTLVLKGHRTVTAFADRRVYINTTGNAGMAKGGSGDVLAGMISGFAGQLQLEKAVIAGVYAHGLTGDICRDKYGEYSMTPSDMIMNIFEATKVLAEK